MQSIKNIDLMKTVLLINPPIYFSDGNPHALDVSVPPLGILYLASYVNKYSSDITALVMDVSAENISLQQITEKVSCLKPFVIGISSMTPQLQGCVELAGFIKNNISNPPKIFLGGPHISADYDFINRFSGIFDYAITGEAEKTFLDSIKSLAQGRDIPKIQGGELIDDLDDIPIPDKNLINRKIYSEYESMIFSRGCPYGCYYCSRPSISKKVRYRSVNNLIDEIKSVYSFCKGKIDFQDDTFTLDKNKVIAFCNVVLKENIHIEWRCNTRVDLVDDELLILMKKAGCGLIHFGIESGNEKVREGIVNKGKFCNKNINDVVKFCNKIGIKTAGYFMIGHPGETTEDLEDTKKIIFNSGINLLGLSIPTPFPGSRLYEIAEKKGIVNERIIDKFAKKELGEGYVGNYPVLVSEDLSKDYLFEEMKSINRKFYINLHTFWERFKSDIFSFSKIRRDAKDFFSLIFKGTSSRKPYLHKKALHNLFF